MQDSIQVIRFNGQLVGLAEVDEHHIGVDFRQGLGFIKDILADPEGGEVNDHIFLDMARVAMFNVSAYSWGIRGKYPISWVAVKFLDELWNLIFSEESPWDEFLLSLSSWRRNSEDEKFICISEIQQTLKDSSKSVEEIMNEWFDQEFPMIYQERFINDPRGLEPIRRPEKQCPDELPLFAWEIAREEAKWRRTYCKARDW
ncbi:hypothetical protein M426DRAFT_25116 [Hypoxylon sp. CI-4A]|nr:hypothetical protein M426DRAFT_25116 [Hypoxylon sp. CI-4A]